MSSAIAKDVTCGLDLTRCMVGFGYDRERATSHDNDYNAEQDSKYDIWIYFHGGFNMFNYRRRKETDRHASFCARMASIFGIR